MSSWQTLADDEGRPYYYNSTTNETSWTLPEEATISPWQVYTSDDGKEYYYNETTGVTTWDKPSELEEGDAGASQNDMEVKATEREVESSDSLAVDSVLDKELADKPCSKENSIAVAKFDNIEDAENAFTKLLKDNKVDSTWPFQKVMSEFIKEPEYWAIPDSLSRKRLYDEYLVNLIKGSLSDKNSVIEVFQNNFTNVLESYKKTGIIRYNTRWLTIKNLLIKEDNSIFKHSVLADSEISKIYYDFRKHLVEEHDESIRTQKLQAIGELETYLTQINTKIVSESKSWEEMYKSLLSDSRFQANKHFIVLNPVDILNLYQDKIYPTLVRSLNLEITQFEKVNYRSDRKARANFKKLLGQLQISANSVFSDFVSQLENEDAFIEICGRNGSTPLELFWDIIDENYQTLKLKKELIYSILVDLRTSDPEQYNLENLLESKEEFVKTLSQIHDERLSSFEIKSSGSGEVDSEIEVIFDTLKKDFKIRQVKRKEVYTAELKRAVEEFSSLLVSKNEELKLISISAEEDALVRKDESTYTVNKAQYEPKKFIESMKSIEQFKQVQNVIHEYHSTPEQSAKEELQQGEIILEEFVYLMKKRQSNKRKQDSSATEDKLQIKRARPDPSKSVKPMVLNY